MITASAPGKLMLFGEHAVVYGAPCLVTAVDLRMRASVRLLEASRVTIRVEGSADPFSSSIQEILVADHFPEPVRFIAFATRQFWGFIRQPVGLEISTRSEFMRSYGLGSSSAVTAAVLAALFQATGLKLDRRRIFELGFAAVRQAQAGIGSGFDVASAVYGGTLYYDPASQEILPLEADNLPLVTGYTGIKAKTTELVQKVARLRLERPRLVDPLLEQIGSVVLAARDALAAQDWPRLGELMSLNQSYLGVLGVSTPELDFLIAAARLQGAYGAKLSGAGGGDCMIALAGEDCRSGVENAIQQSGILGAEVLHLPTGAEGARIEP